MTFNFFDTIPTMSPEADRIFGICVNTVAACVVGGSLMLTAIVFLLLLFLKPNMTPQSNKQLRRQSKMNIYASLTHISIIFVIFTDMLYSLVLLPQVVLFFVADSYYSVQKNNTGWIRFFLILLNEFAEALYMSSTIWHLIATIFLYMSIAAVKRRVTDTNEGDAMVVEGDRSSSSFCCWSIASHLAAWTLPLVVNTVFLILFEYSEYVYSLRIIHSFVDNADKKLRIGARIASDLSKTSFYIFIESLMIIVRVVICFRANALFSETVAFENSPNEQRGKKEQSRVYSIRFSYHFVASFPINHVYTTLFHLFNIANCYASVLWHWLGNSYCRE